MRSADIPVSSCLVVALLWGAAACSRGGEVPGSPGARAAPPSSAGVAKSTDFEPQPALCGGQRLPVKTETGAAAPYLDLALGGEKGAWLLDYGHTASRVSTRIWPPSQVPDERKGTNDAGNSVFKLDGFSFPGWESQTISFEYEDWAHSPAGVGYQQGIIGVDLLSNQAVELHYEDPGDQYLIVGKWGAACPSSAFAARGFRRIAQEGYFEYATRVSKGVSNTPVVFIELEKNGAAGAAAPLAGLATYAQIDTGYNDSARLHSVDVNKPFEDLLLKLDPKPKLLGSINVQDCDQVYRPRRVYRADGWRLRIQDEHGKLIFPLNDFHFIVKEKQPERCGGITQDPKPAAQLGASFLRRFGTTIFIPQAKEVWIRPLP